MAHITMTAVLLVLLLSSASLGGSTGTEYNVMTISTESHGDKQDDVNVIQGLENEMTKYQKARKMRAFAMKKDSTKTGLVTKTEMMPMGSSPNDASQKDTRMKTQLSKSQAKPGANQNFEPHSTDEGINEIFNMLRRDYHSAARRRGPINNAIPLDDEQP